MSIRVEFEAANAKMLWQQIVEYIEVATGNPAKPAPATAPVVDVKAEAAQAKAQVTANEPAPASDTPPAPTPAIIQALTDNEIPESEWSAVARTGKGNRMTKADVLKYAKTRAVELLNTDPSVPVLDDGLMTPADVTAEDAGIMEPTPEPTPAPTPEPTPAPAEDPFDALLSGSEAKPQPTRKDVNNALSAAYSSDTGGHIKCLALLDRFAVKATKDLSADVYADFIGKCNGMADGTYDPEAVE